MKRSFKERILALNLSYQKEMIILLVINVVEVVLALLAYIFLKQVLSFLLLGVALAISNYFYLSRYSSLERKLEQEHVDELISLLAYFEMFITNGNNVYTSFKMLLPYCSIFMEDAINSFLNQIDDDKSVGPYINFASKFTNRIIESLMLSIYQMVDNGENSEQFVEFNFLFSGVSKDYQVNKIDNKKKSLSALDSLPLFGAGAITIILAISILSIVGEFIDVI